MIPRSKKNINTAQFFLLPKWQTFPFTCSTVEICLIVYFLCLIYIREFCFFSLSFVRIFFGVDSLAHSTKKYSRNARIK